MQQPMTPQQRREIALQTLVKQIYVQLVAKNVDFVATQDRVNAQLVKAQKDAEYAALVFFNYKDGSLNKNRKPKDAPE